ncbi:hypothetical protein BN1723_020779, partial [Verticillium longisporum]
PSPSRASSSGSASAARRSRSKPRTSPSPRPSCNRLRGPRVPTLRARRLRSTPRRTVISRTTTPSSAA